MANDAEQQKTGEEPARSAAARTALRETIAALLEQAQHEILVFGPDLDGYYFNTARVADALGRFIARHRENRARILVEHRQQVIRDNARLIALARRFADAVQLRRVSEDHTGSNELFIVVDSRTCLYQQDADRIDRPIAMQQLREAALLARRFRTIWELGEPLVEIKPAGL